MTTDKDGFIGPDDFAAQMARMGDPVFPEQLQAFYHWFDEMGNGHVDFPKWLQQCLRLCVCGVTNQALENKAKAKAAAKYDSISRVCHQLHVTWYFVFTMCVVCAWQGWQRPQGGQVATTGEKRATSRCGTRRRGASGTYKTCFSIGCECHVKFV